MQAKVICVYNEGAKENTPLIGAKGFGLLVEVDGQRTLLDTGMRGRYLIHNLGHMHIKPDSIDRVILTHNHKSNITGLKKLLESRSAPIDVFTNGSYPGIKGIGKDDVIGKMEWHAMDGRKDLSEHLSVIGPFGPLEEFVLILRTKRGPAVMSSCFHCGLDIVLDAAKREFGNEPVAVIGGMHIHRPKQDKVDPVVNVLRDHGSPKLYINHCGTPGTIMYMRVRFGLSGVNDLYVGDEAEFEV